MTLTELMNAVYTETNRPDLIAETQQKVFASIFKLHCMEFFYKDIATSEAIFDTAAYVQTIDTSAFPRYRSLSYFRKNDPSLLQYQLNPTLLPPLYSGAGLPTATSMGFLTVITPDNILDEYRAERLDVCYQAGGTLYIKASTAITYGLVGWYQYPNLSTDPAAFDSWIAREFPYAIIFDAASGVLQSIGMTDAARKYDNEKDGLATTQRNIVIMNNIVAQGR